MGARSVLVLAELTDGERSVFEQDCENCNFEVTWLTSAEMVGPKLVSGKFDTLVVHLHTPGAARACMEARTVLTRVHFPIMALADRVDDAVFNKAFRVGADDVIQLGASAQVSQRLVAIPRPSWKPAGQSRGEALIIDPDRGRADALGRLLKEAGYLIKSVREEAAGKLHLGRQSVRLVVTEGEAGATANLIRAGNRKEWCPIWLVRARPDQLDMLGTELAAFKNAAVVNAYSSASDVLYEANRLVDERECTGISEAQLLFGTTLKFSADAGRWHEHGFTYALGLNALSVRTLALPPSTELELELVPPAGAAALQLSGEVTERRLFGQPQRQSAPPGFTVRLSGANLEAWQKAIRAAYEQRFGRELPEVTGPQQRASRAVEAVSIGRVKLINAPESSAPAVPNRALSEANERDTSSEPSAEAGPSGDTHAPTTLLSVESLASDSDGEPLDREQQSSTGSGGSDTSQAEPPPVQAEPGLEPPPDDGALARTAISAAHPTAPERSAGGDALATRSEEPMQEHYEPPQVADTPDEGSQRGHAVPSAKSAGRGSGGAMLAWLMVFAAAAFGLWIASRPSAGPGEHGTAPQRQAEPDAANAATRVQALTSVSTSTTQSPNRDRQEAENARPGGAAADSVAEISDAPPAEPELEVDPGDLPGHLAYLYVSSALDTQVFVQGKLVGRTNTPVQTFCGRRFIRLGSAPGHWQSPGVTFRIACQKLNRLTLRAEAAEQPERPSP